MIDSKNVGEVANSLKPLLEENYDLVLRKLLKKIVKHSYICSYVFVVLTKRLECPKLEKDVVRLSREKLFTAVREERSQECLEWARFEGELYTYELIDKEDLYGIMHELLKIE